MKLLRISTRLFLGVMSIFVLAACGGGSGGPGGAASPAGFQNSPVPGAGPLGLR